MKYLFLIFLVSFILSVEYLVIGLGANNLVYRHDGVYEKLLIYDGEYKGRPTRFFQQDRSNSGARYLDTDELVFDYTKYYALYKIFNPQLKKALIIGGGAYSIPKALLKEPGVELVEVAEIEPSLYDLAKKYFRLADDQRLTNHVIDGRRWLHDSQNRYDLIFSDVYYSLYSVPVHFTTEEFFKLAKSKLNDKGVFMANLIGNLDNRPPSLIFSEIKTFKAVFPNSYFFAVNSPDIKATQNIIFLGFNSDQTINFSESKIKNNPDKIISQAGEKLIGFGQIDFSLYNRLSDNYAPVEYLTAKVLD